MGAIHHRSKIIALLAVSFLMICSLPMGAALAQSGCTGDPCVFDTPTITPTLTPLPTPGTGTPTAVPMPPAVPFPHPNYSAPTSIPGITWPSINPNGYNPAPVNLPSPLAVNYTPQAFSTPEIPNTATAVPLSTANSTLELSFVTPVALEFESELTGTMGNYASGLIDGGYGVISDVVSYTGYISGQITAIQPTGSITIAQAPDWYAPHTPREMADIGWTFEQLGEDMVNGGSRYSLTTWANLIGYMAAMPIRLAKNIWELLKFLGPFGLLVIWLFAMVIMLLPFKFLIFLKNLFIRLVNFILGIIKWVLDLLKMLPFV